MIRNDLEYQEMLRRLEGGQKTLREYQAKLEAEGLSPDHVASAIAPSKAFVLEVREEVAHYQRIKRGDLDPLVNLHGLGQALIAARVAAGVTQRNLAARLEVHESQVSRDERNEYFGVTVERASRILDALGVTLTSAFVGPPAKAEEPVAAAQEAPRRVPYPRASAKKKPARAARWLRGIRPRYGFMNPRFFVVKLARCANSAA